MKLIWHWLTDAKNRDVLRLTAAGFAAVVTAAWAVLTFVVNHHTPASITSGPGSIAAGHDISGNTITLAPPGATALPPTIPAAKPP